MATPSTLSLQRGDGSTQSAAPKAPGLPGNDRATCETSILHTNSNGNATGSHDETDDADSSEHPSMVQGSLPSPAQDHELWHFWDDVRDDELPSLTDDLPWDQLAVCVPCIPSQSPNLLEKPQDSLIVELSPKTVSQLPPQLIHFDSKLVEAYFSVVCPIFSTFDSQHNQFRSFVGQNWQSSVPIYYAMLSMAAAKLSWQAPYLKTYALRTQSMALKSLYAVLPSVGSLSTELLFVVLLLGLSASWHDISDLGTIHLRALQHAITTHRVLYSDEFQHLDFFKGALVYWEMVACSVDDNVSIRNYSKMSCHPPQQTRSNNVSSITGARINPHPWAGVALAPQAIFSHIVRHIRSLRSFDLDVSSSQSILSRPKEFLKKLHTLEEELWTLELPKLHEIANTGDENTPPIHHLLLAEAYMFACLYQLYYIFPNIRRKRVLLILAEDYHCSSRQSWAESQKSSWTRLLQEGGESEEWLDFIGSSIINRLEQVQISSGTSCVHALLLLVGSGSLSVRPEHEGTDTERETLRSREFVLRRLSSLSNRLLSAPLHAVESVASEIFKRLDLGVRVFWMDVLQSMGVVTIIG